jgi:chaperonin GroES
MFIQAVKDKIFAKVIKQETTTKGGLIVPGTVRKDPQKTGKVISVGADVKTILVNDIIMFHDRGGQVILLDEEEYRILSDSEIYGVVTDK